MTPLDKAEAVLAAFRGEVECPKCRQYVAPDAMVMWQWQFESANSYVTAICRDCWYDGLEEADRAALARGDLRGEPQTVAVSRYISEVKRAIAKRDLQDWTGVDWAAKTTPGRSDD